MWERKCDLYTSTFGTAYGGLEQLSILTSLSIRVFDEVSNSFVPNGSVWTSLVVEYPRDHEPQRTCKSSAEGNDKTVFFPSITPDHPLLIDNWFGFTCIIPSFFSVRDKTMHITSTWVRFTSSICSWKPQMNVLGELSRPFNEHKELFSDPDPKGQYAREAFQHITSHDFTINRTYRRQYIAILYDMDTEQPQRIRDWFDVVCACEISKIWGTVCETYIMSQLPLQTRIWSIYMKLVRKKKGFVFFRIIPWDPSIPVC